MPFSIFYNLSCFFVAVRENHGVNSRENHREVEQEMVIDFRVIVMDECHDNQRQYHSQSGTGNNFVAVETEIPLVLDAVFHSVKQVKVKSNHHPNNQTNPGI